MLQLLLQDSRQVGGRSGDSASRRYPSADSRADAGAGGALHGQRTRVRVVHQWDHGGGHGGGGGMSLAVVSEGACQGEVAGEEIGEV